MGVLHNMYRVGINEKKPKFIIKLKSFFFFGPKSHPRQSFRRIKTMHPELFTDIVDQKNRLEIRFLRPKIAPPVKLRCPYLSSNMNSDRVVLTLVTVQFSC